MGTLSAEYDVVVVGSGSAALTAALASAASGLSVAIVEKSRWLGGTTALSGAGTWVPANHHALAAGIEDSPQLALDYVRAVSPPGWRETEDPLWSAMLHAGPEMLKQIEALTPLRFDLTAEGDPWPAAPGALPRGRMLSPRMLSRRILGQWRSKLRPPMLPHFFTYQEAQRYDAFHHPYMTAMRLLPQLAWRILRSERANGTALVTGLLKGCLDLGCDVHLSTPATRLITSRDEVTGVVVEQQGESIGIAARVGVVLATGGFEWDKELLAKHFPGPVDYANSPPTNTGDGHRMAMSVGAAMAHMDQANLSGGAPVRYDGISQGMSVHYFREPNAVVVNGQGERFGNEFSVTFMEAMQQRNADGSAPNLPAWVISDTSLLRKSPILRSSMRVRRDWIVRGRDLADLAKKIGVPQLPLASTIEAFNKAAWGERDNFGRAARDASGNPLIVPIGDAPIAIPFNQSFVSTKGGPRTDQHGRVLRPDGSVIGGLFCAGVAMANPIGTRPVGAGTTIGPNLTWGYICGTTMAAIKRGETP